MTALWISAAVGALIYWPWVLGQTNWVRTSLKTGPVLCLAGIALWAAQPLLAVALMFCAMGDACLSRDGDTAFRAGVIAFAIGHILYVTLFVTQPEASFVHLMMPSTGFALLGLATLGVVMTLRIVPVAGPLRGAVAMYIPLILLMGAAALTLPASLKGSLVLLGAALFVLSDTLLAVETFLLDPNAELRCVIAYMVWPTYWIAQAVFVAAFAGVPIG